MKNKSKLTFLEFLLKESPQYNSDIEYTKKIFIKHDENGMPDSGICDETLKKKYKIIGEFVYDGSKMIIGINPKIRIVNVFLPMYSTEINQMIHGIVCTLKLSEDTQKVAPLPYFENKTIIQESTVSTVPKYQGKGFASALYVALLKNDYVIISDKIHFLGGMKLWKRLAKNEKIIVNVYDKINEDYLKDSSGYIINYDTTNIAENDIWKAPHAGTTLLLVATIL